MTDDGASWETLDGLGLSEAERDERKRFYESEVGDTQWRVRQIPGLNHLRTQLRAYERARDTRADPVILRSHLDSLAAEIERQRADVDQGDKGGRA